MSTIGAVFILLGMFFFGVGVVGVYRLPDAYSRLHATSKVATLGLFCLLLGAALIMPEAGFRLLALGLFIIVSAPLTSHIIAASTYDPKTQQERDPNQGGAMAFDA